MNHAWGLKSGDGDYTESSFSTDAVVLGNADVYRSTVEDFSILAENVKVRRSKFYGGRSVVTGKAHIVNSVVKNCVISGNVYIINSNLENCVITDEAFISSSTISNIYLWGKTRVLGCNGNTAYLTNCKVENIIIPTGCIIEEGVWHRPPMTFITSSGQTVCESVDDKVIISCTNNKISKWLSGAGRRYGKIIGLTDEEINEIQGRVEEIRDSKNKG